MEHLISVIIPCYNVEAYLPRCIESVLNQTYRNLEIILIDDGSPDSCGEVCDSYARRDSRITVIHQENKGLSGARNVGINISKGDYLFFLDSDDCICINTLETLYKIAVEYDSELTSGEFYQGSNPEVLHDDGEGKIFVGSGAQVLDTVLQYATWSAWGKLYSRALIGDDRFAEGFLYEDFEFVPRQYLKAYRCAHCRLNLYFYFIRETSIMGDTKSCLKPYYIDFAEKNLQQVRKSDFSEVSKERVLASFYRQMMWGLSKPMRAYGVKQNKDVLVGFSKLLRKELSSILKNRYLEWIVKERYVVLFISPTIYEALFRLSYFIKHRRHAV